LSTNQFMSRRAVSAAIHSRAWLTDEYRIGMRVLSGVLRASLVILRNLADRHQLHDVAVLGRDRLDLVLDAAGLGVAPVDGVERVRAVAALEDLAQGLGQGRSLDLDGLQLDSRVLEVRGLRRAERDVDRLLAVAGREARVLDVDAGVEQRARVRVVDRRSVRLEVLAHRARRRCGERGTEQRGGQERWRASAHDESSRIGLPHIPRGPGSLHRCRRVSATRSAWRFLHAPG
jgi:hypothetical protein